MPCKTPSFWYQSPEKLSFATQALRPISSVYALISRINYKLKKTIQYPDIKIICVGNITAGGSGKTPITIALCELLKQKKLAKTPHILTRGYGRTDKASSFILRKEDIGSIPVHQSGDEPRLLARAAPVIIATDRASGAKMAHDSGADIIVMDDGFQNPVLKKDVSLLVIDGNMGFGNEKTIPAGPLRESPDRAIARAEACIFIGEDKHDILNRYIKAARPVFTAKIQVPSDFTPAQRGYTAFSGIGFPQKFNDTLKEIGCNISSFHSFADHHTYTEKELNFLLDQSKRTGTILITTEKDYVRLPLKWQNEVTFLPISLTFDEPEKLWAFLKKELNK